MTALFSPFELGILIHYHAHCEDWRNASSGDLAPAGTMQQLVKLNLLTYDPTADMKYQPTDRLHAYVEILCSIPLPVQKWVGADVELRQPMAWSVPEWPEANKKFGDPIPGLQESICEVKSNPHGIT